jgi:excisionase family DNA binding protein
MAEKTLWDVKQCAQYLGKSPRWLWREIARGNVPHVRVGKSLRFYPEEIDAWLRSGCHASR